MKIYVTNIQWDYDPYSITEEQLTLLPTNVVIEIDTDLCENGDDIETYYTEDVDNLCDYAQCMGFEYSLLGFDLDVVQTIGTDTHRSYVDYEQSLTDYEAELKEYVGGIH